MQRHTPHKQNSKKPLVGRSSSRRWLWGNFRGFPARFRSSLWSLVFWTQTTLTHKRTVLT